MRTIAHQEKLVYKFVGFFLKSATGIIVIDESAFEDFSIGLKHFKKPLAVDRDAITRISFSKSIPIFA